MSHNDKLIEFMRVLEENMVKSGYDCSQWDQGTEAKQDHAGMRQQLDEDKFTKIAVMGYENPLLLVRSGENVAVG